MSATLAPMQAALGAGNVLGEGIVWCDREQALYWTDIEAATLWRFKPATHETRQWNLPERLASIALCEVDGWLLLALASRLAFFHLEDGELRTVCEVEPQLPTRCNDGACDRQGRFVFGTLHEPADSGAKHAIGSFWRLDADLSLQRLPLESVTIANSIAFTSDGSIMYYCDTLTRTIRSCVYGETLGESRVFADLGDTAGEPDGSAVDSEGGLWNAQWGSSRVIRYRSDGEIDCILPVPTRHPTRPAFGGAMLDTLYVTSAREGPDTDSLAGALFCAPVAQRGLHEPRFAGAPASLNRERSHIGPSRTPNTYADAIPPERMP